MLTRKATSILSTPLFTTKSETTTNSVSNTSVTNEATSIVSTPTVTTDAAPTTMVSG